MEEKHPEYGASISVGYFALPFCVYVSAVKTHVLAVFLFQVLRWVIAKSNQIFLLGFQGPQYSILKLADFFYKGSDSKYLECRAMWCWLSFIFPYGMYISLRSGLLLGLPVGDHVYPSLYHLSLLPTLLACLLFTPLDSQLFHMPFRLPGHTLVALLKSCDFSGLLHSMASKQRVAHSSV